jgi:phosphate-selective porin OprO/OprP
MRRLSILGLFALLWSRSLCAQEPDLKELIRRLDRLEAQNMRLAEQNEELKQEIRELKKAAPSPSPEAVPPPATPTTSDEVKALIREAFHERDARKRADEDKKKADDARPKSFVVGKNLKVEGVWRDSLWFETADHAFRWSVGGVAQSDMTWFGGAQPVVTSIGVFNGLADPGESLSDGFGFRRARLRFSGFMWEQIEFRAQYEFANALDLRRRTLGVSPAPAAGAFAVNDLDPNETVGFNEVFAGVTQLPILGTIRVGRQRESLNFITATADNNQIWLERGLMFDAFNGDYNFSNGVTIQRNFLEGDRAYAMVGYFQQNSGNNRNFASNGDGDHVYDGRICWLPLYDDDRELWVHVGADYSYRNLYRDQVRYRARPMVRPGPSFTTPSIVSSGTLFSPDAQQIANLEFAAAYGRFTFTAEYTVSWLTNAYTGGMPGTAGVAATPRGTYFAQGTYAEALVFLTPDHRRYRKDRPGHDRIVPRNTFYLMHGEHGLIFDKGAWEIGLRYDYVDLTHNGVNGGMSNAATVALNWYLNPNFRVQWNYFVQDREFSPADAPSTSGPRVDGIIQGLGMRFNMDF